MIHKEIMAGVTWYWLVCAVCGAESSRCVSVAAASIVARKDAWWVGKNPLCPPCQTDENFAQIGIIDPAW